MEKNKLHYTPLPLAKYLYPNRNYINRGSHELLVVVIGLLLMSITTVLSYLYFGRADVLSVQSP